MSDAMRLIPNLEFWAPWFCEPLVAGITHKDYRNLSEHAQRPVRFRVADSREVVNTGVILRAPRIDPLGLD